MSCRRFLAPHPARSMVRSRGSPQLGGPWTGRWVEIGSYVPLPSTRCTGRWCRSSSWSYGPLVVLPEILAHVGKVREAYIYGSWAARYSGEAGSAPRDLDVLLVGSPSRPDMTAAAAAASARLGLEVNMARVETSDWDRDEDGFVGTVRSRPHVALKLTRTTQDGQG